MFEKNRNYFAVDFVHKTEITELNSTFFILEYQSINAVMLALIFLNNNYKIIDLFNDIQFNVLYHAEWKFEFLIFPVRDSIQFFQFLLSPFPYLSKCFHRCTSPDEALPDVLSYNTHWTEVRKEKKTLVPKMASISMNLMIQKKNNFTQRRVWVDIIAVVKGTSTFN